MSRRDDQAQKALTVRLSLEQAEELEAVASVERLPVAEVIRKAIAHHVEARRLDHSFQLELQESLERNQQLLRRLAPPSPGGSQ